MSGIFENIKVIDLTNNIAGPTAASMLADYGAYVIKVEKPGLGDDNRGFAPFIKGKSMHAVYHNRGKHSIVLDMKKPEGIELLKELIREADVLVESFRPGVLKKLGLAYEDITKINEKIIMCSVSGHGQTGPNAMKPGYDMIAQALSGIMSVTGVADGTPTRIGSSIGDYIGGITAFGSIASALYYRSYSGVGQYIDISLVESLLACNEYCEFAYNDVPMPKRSGNHHPTISPFGVFSGREGELVIGAVSPNLWVSLCKAMGREDLIGDERYDNPGKRAHHMADMLNIIEGWLCTFDNIDEAKAILENYGIPCAKVNTLDDIKKDAHLIARGMQVEIKAPDMPDSKLTVRGPSIKFSKTPGKIAFSPSLGEHTVEVLRDYLKYEDAQIAQLKEEGIVK